MYRKTVFLVLGFVFVSTSLAAQNEEPDDPFTPQTAINDRYVGIQSFAITAGLFVPIAISSFTDYAGKPKGTYFEQLNVGGFGSLIYSFYINSHIKVGLQFSLGFASDVNKKWLYMFPIILRGVYELRPMDRITIPFSLGIGVNLVTWREEFHSDLILKPGVGIYFDLNSDWSFGFDASYWFVPQFYSKNPEFNTLGHFMDFSLTAEYHFK